MSTWLLNYFWKWTLSHYIHLCVLGFLSRWFSCGLVCHSISLSILEIVEFCRNRKKKQNLLFATTGLTRPRAALPGFCKIERGGAHHTGLTSMKRFTNLKLNLKCLGLYVGAKMQHVSYEFEYFYQCIMTIWGLSDSNGPILMHQAHLVQN